MPALNFSRIDLDLIYPPFLERVLNVIARCEARGCRYVATHGFRTYGEQTALWAQGRTRPGKIVTNAMGGQSAHNFGLAIDFVRDIDTKTPGVQPGWSSKDYEVLISEAERAGLHSGASYKDYPHVSWPGTVSAKDLLGLALTWDNTSPSLGTLDRLKEVWKVVNHPFLDPQDGV